MPYIGDKIGDGWWLASYIALLSLLYCQQRWMARKHTVYQTRQIWGLVILLKSDWNRRIFSPCDLEICWMTSTNNMAPILYFIKLCASFRIHRWIQTGVTVRKRSIQVTIGNFLSRVTLKFHGLPWKTIWHLFYATSSFEHHFKAIGKSKLKLQSGNAQFGSKSAIFLSRVTLKFDGWHWKTSGHFSYVASSFMHHLIAISEL